jgi:hypothetical protein
MAAVAVAAALSTGAISAAIAGPGRHFSGAAVYVAVTVLALFSPAAVTVQVIVGQLLVATLLLGGPRDPLLLVPVVAGIVVTAELLAVVARLDTPIERDPGEVLRPAGLAAVIAGAVFGVVALVGGVPGPTGILAVVLACGACVVLATRLAQEEE